MHRNASPHSHPSSGVPWEGLPCSHMGVNALAVHSEQVVCNEHTERQPASAILCTAACTVLMQRQHRWPVVTMTMSDLAYRNLSALV